MAARALVQPSFYEGLPVVIMEAMALARPVISTYVGGIPELVEHNKTGWLVPASDDSALAGAMAAALEAGSSNSPPWALQAATGSWNVMTARKKPKNC